jgi:hypothetical protein
MERRAGTRGLVDRHPAGALDHLLDHLSVGVKGVPGGATELCESGNWFSEGLHGWSWGPRAICTLTNGDSISAVPKPALSVLRRDDIEGEPYGFKKRLSGPRFPLP